MTEPTVGAVFGPDELETLGYADEWLSNTRPWRVADSKPDPSIRSHAGWEIASASYPDGHHTLAAIVELVNAWPHIREALRSAWAERDDNADDRDQAIALSQEIADANDRLREELKRATDRADLLNDALADAARHIGDSDALNRANAVLRADTDGKLSPRHRDAMGVPQFCDDAQAELSNHRTWIDDADTALQQTLGDRWSPDRPIPAGVQALATERDQARDEVGSLEVTIVEMNKVLTRVEDQRDQAQAAERQRVLDIIQDIYDALPSADWEAVGTALYNVQRRIRAIEEGADRG